MESTLQLSYEDLIVEVSIFNGWGRGPDHDDREWTGEEKQRLKSCVDSGLRQFYFPPPLELQPGGYEWSFLRPVATLTLASGEQSVQLPADFGGLEGQVYDTTSGGFGCPLRVSNEGMITQQYGLFPDSSGTPSMVALRHLKGTSKSRGPRSELYFFPAADEDRTIKVQYYILPDCLTRTHPYPYGGAQHAETIKESCLAIAEQLLDNTVGVHTMKFRERLMASIQMDRRNKPQYLGRNLDRSDEVYGFGSWRRNDQHVSFHGVEYD